MTATDATLTATDLRRAGYRFEFASGLFASGDDALACSKIAEALNAFHSASKGEWADGKVPSALVAKYDQAESFLQVCSDNLADALRHGATSPAKGYRDALRTKCAELHRWCDAYADALDDVFVTTF